jgi:hypothetical protein
MTVEEVAALALALPEAAEAPHFDMASFRIRGKIFATVAADGEHLHVFVAEDDVAAWTAEDPGAYAELRWGKRLSGLRVTLARAQPAHVAEMLEDAWRRKAPKKVAAAFDADASRG